MRLRCSLRRLREAQGLSLKQMSERTGINHGTLSQYEHGRTLPTDRHLPALTAAYGAALVDWYPAMQLLALELDPDDER